MELLTKKKKMKTVNGSANTRTDGALVKRYLKGDSQAINTIIERHRSRVYNYILMMVHDRALADDIFQETFVKAISSLDKGKYVDGGKLISWLLRIAHNQVIDHFRSRKNKHSVTSDDVGFDIISVRSGNLQQNAEDMLVRAQTEEQIHQLVDTLPIEQREVVVMRHFMDLSFKEIADQTGVSINTALGRMRYALINLRKTIEQRELELI